MTATITEPKKLTETPSSYVNEVLAATRDRNPGQDEFLQAVYEVFSSLGPVVDKHSKYRNACVLERMAEPERIVEFRIAWLDDDEQVQVNRGYRIGFSSTLGPYKGGLRFHPTVNQSVLKFLGFEQVFKNSLTGISLGGGKGGADFDPKGRSDMEIMRFCQSLMNELYRHVGADTDVPAGDIGVGGREIGYLFGQYKKLTNQFTGVLTGKGPSWGGSNIRTEATGYGCAYFGAAMLDTKGETFKGKRCIVSGAGNVAQYLCEKLLDLGAIPVTMSDSGGFIYDPDGIDRKKLDWIMTLKNERRGRISEYAEQFKNAEFTKSDRDADANPIWQVDADCAFPCATQNELNGKDAKHLIDNGVGLVCEGANMPSTPDAMDAFLDKGVLFGPAKAANAGGVAVSGLEMAQNSMRQSWSRDEVDTRLKDIMHLIHAKCVDAAGEYDLKDNYVAGANIAGFTRVADAMIDQGVV